MRFREILREFVTKLADFEHEGYRVFIFFRDSVPEIIPEPMKPTEGDIKANTVYMVIGKDNTPIKTIYPPGDKVWPDKPHTIGQLKKKAKEIIDTDIKPGEVERAKQDQEERERQYQARQLGNRTNAKRKKSTTVIFNVKLLEELGNIPQYGSVYEENGKNYLLVSDDEGDKDTFNMQTISDWNTRQEDKKPRLVFALTRKMMSQAPSIAERSRYTVDVNHKYTGELAEYPVSYHSEVERGPQDKTSHSEFLKEPGITISSVFELDSDV